MVREGDRVRCYICATRIWEVVETDVERDVDVDAGAVYRIPSGDTLIQDNDVAMVAPKKQMTQYYKDA